MRSLVAALFAVQKRGTAGIGKFFGPLTLLWFIAIALLVVAGYHELGQSQWRELIKLPAAPEAAWWRMAIPANKVKIRVQLSAQGIVLLPED